VLLLMPPLLLMLLMEAQKKKRTQVLRLLLMPAQGLSGRPSPTSSTLAPNGMCSYKLVACVVSCIEE
jgi:hypothetical protein